MAERHEVVFMICKCGHRQSHKKSILFIKSSCMFQSVSDRLELCHFFRQSNSQRNETKTAQSWFPIDGNRKSIVGDIPLVFFPLRLLLENFITNVWRPVSFRTQHTHNTKLIFMWWCRTRRILNFLQVWFWRFAVVVHFKIVKS